MLKRLLIALLLLPLAVSAYQAEEVTERNFQRLRDHIMPSAAEEEWRKIPWRTTYWQGVVDAQKADKPVFLFAMNGHPFGCT
jgi:hypothetical protein